MIDDSKPIATLRHNPRSTILHPYPLSSFILIIHPPPATGGKMLTTAPSLSSRSQLVS